MQSLPVSIPLMTLASLASQLPMLIVYVVGIVLPMVFWSRCPKACLMVLIASSALLAELFVRNALMFRLAGAAQGGGAWADGRVLMAVSGLSVLLHAGCWGLLLAAVFVARPRPAGVA